MMRPFKPVNFGRYLLTDRIAVGGMAEIFNAKIFGAMGFEKSIVIKRILPQFAEDAEFLRMFITEAKLVCHLEHPNIVQVHELGELDGQYYIAMEFVNGVDGRQLWRTLAKRRQRLPGVLALFVVSEFLKGLDYAHRTQGADGRLLGLVHRDVSPSNILISYRGDVKIGDFGIALVQHESKTQAGVLKGKYGYMSPEQVAGLNVDHRSDIFAAGIVLAELLLGRRLFLGRSDFETLDKVMNVRLDVLDQHAAALPPDAVRIVQTALQREVGDRYQSAREFCDDITDFLFSHAERVTNETLAAFLAQHVAPFLERHAQSPGSSDPDDSDAVNYRGSPPAGQAPVVPTGALPRADEGRPPAPPSRFASSGAIPTVEVPPAAPPPASRSMHDTLHELDPLAVATPEAASGWNAAAAASYPFGALPQLDMGLVSQPSEELELDTISDDGFSSASMARPAPDAGDVEGAGEELDLDGGDEEPLYAPPQLSAPEALLSAQLATAQEVEQRDRPDFTGKIPNRTVAKVLFRFAAVQESGLLILTGPETSDQNAALLRHLNELQALVARGAAARAGTERTCEIHLVGGHPHLVAADRSEQALVGYLIREGVVDLAAVEKAVRANPHRSLIAALQGAGLITPLQISRKLTTFVLENVLDTFAWEQGGFAFYRGRACTHEAFPTGMTAFELVHRGVRALPDAVLQRYFVRLGTRKLGLCPSPVVELADFNPDELERSVYQRLGAPQPLPALLTSCLGLGDPLAVTRALYLFIESELAELS
ncbi:MAG: serine/threonine protein kinase [Deltaproteobacteria bacterium]|nr:serine/threonine protein kinase [Deltaproteobacteria bacterium]